MALIELLSKEKGAILERWHQRVLETYPAETAGFLGQTKEPFANPVGATLLKELPVVYQALLGTADPTRTAQALDDLVRLRAVQNFSPSQAIGFIFTLKSVIRELVGDALSGPDMLEEWPGVEARIDCAGPLGLRCVCREQGEDVRYQNKRHEEENLHFGTRGARASQRGPGRPGAMRGGGAS